MSNISEKEFSKLLEYLLDLKNKNCANESNLDILLENIKFSDKNISKKVLEYLSTIEDIKYKKMESI